MFWFGKKKEKAAEIVPTNTSIEEEMGLKEYVSFDSVKAHLVDVLEENRRLKQEEKDRRTAHIKSGRRNGSKKNLH